MMINESIYRLGTYRIAEYENGLLHWETHFNFGVQRSGKCYIFGNILILGDWSHEEAGYLQLEFSELLQKLPAWNSTRYYCLSSELLNVSTGQNLTNDFLEHHIALTRITESKPLIDMRPGISRLGRYQITVADNGEVSWQTYESLNRVVSGRCVIESDLLLIGPQEYDEVNQSKREFLNKLNQLSEWDKTMAWCRSYVLRPCNVEAPKTENHNFQEIITVEFQMAGNSMVLDMWRKKVVKISYTSVFSRATTRTCDDLVSSRKEIFFPSWWQATSP
jgi:hypothetical protein